MRRAIFLLLLALGGTASAESKRPPVVFVRGYDFHWIFGYCSPQHVTPHFGSLPGQLQSEGVAVYAFDDCAEAGKQIVSIEKLGQLFGQFLQKIPAPQVDIVAHSMGGLVVRSYVAGLQPGANAPAPPRDPKIRKVVFVAVPQQGLEIPLRAGSNTQLTEMRPGSKFLTELAKSNLGVDGFRQVDTISIAGSGAADGGSDGLVSLNSASLLSLGRAPERTRILSYCHASILASLRMCTGEGIAASAETSKIVRSFFAGTSDWAKTGRPISTPGTTAAGTR